MYSNDCKDTIVALASAAGRAGVGVIRISGKHAKPILQTLIGQIPPARQATLCRCIDADGQLLDSALTLWFPAPHSFTGEDVAEIQAHGSPVILDLLIARIVELGARIAKPGEFSERAFLNEKLDLAQAEAIADLINSTSSQAAKSALRSLSGEFSKKIETLATQLLHLRMYVEAAIDFPEEEIDFLSDGHVLKELQSCQTTLDTILSQAKQGALLREGMTVVLAGAPNAGKSSLLNALSGQDSAIVTDIPGTTRDLLREHIHIEGVPLTIIDTAGLRLSEDIVEQEGIKRAKHAVNLADLCLLLVDGANNSERDPEVLLKQLDLPSDIKAKAIIIINKIDKTYEAARREDIAEHPCIWISAKNHEGLDLLKKCLLDSIGFHPADEGMFLARRRHLNALNATKALLERALNQFTQQYAGELLAEDLRLAHDTLGEITGRVSSDDLLGEIFSQFCIGK